MKETILDGLLNHLHVVECLNVIDQSSCNRPGYAYEKLKKDGDPFGVRYIVYDIAKDNQTYQERHLQEDLTLRKPNVVNGQTALYDTD